MTISPDERPQFAEHDDTGDMYDDEAQHIRNRDVKLSFVQEYPGCVRAYLEDAEKPSSRALLCRVDATKNLFSIYPLVAWAQRYDFLGPKYSKLRTLELHGFNLELREDPISIVDTLLELPAGFVKSADYGLGLKRELLPFTQSLEDMGVETLVISKFESTASLEGSIYILPWQQYEDVRKHLNRISEKHRRWAFQEKRVAAHQRLLSSVNPDQSCSYPARYRPNTLAAVARSAADAGALTRQDREAALDVVRGATKQLAKEDSTTLLALKTDIEIVTLETLIRRFEEMIDKNQSEARWQSFLSSNPFVLSLAFGYPVLVIAGQASIGGTAIGGRGQKITDFLLQTEGTGNCALVEIKKPSSKLLADTEYRHALYAPSRELAGAISQCLDQRYHFQKNFQALKQDSDLPDLQAYCVHAVLLIGKIPTERNQKKSFELLRGATQNVAIITFDELLAKLHTVLRALKEHASPDAGV